MKLREHLVIGGAAAIALYLYRDWALWKTALFFASSVLIDADHYWDYLWRNRFADWSGWRMFRFYDRLRKSYDDKRYLAFSLLHTVEIFLLVYILARLWSGSFFMPILWGMLFHLFWDVVDLTYWRKPFLRAYSVVEYLVRKRLMIKRGLDPDGFYKEIFIFLLFLERWLWF